MAHLSTLHLFFPVSLGSAIVTRFIATTDTLTPARIHLAAALLQAVLPDSCACCSGHSTPYHPCAERGSASLPSETSRLIRRFSLGPIDYFPDFAMIWQARPVHRPYRVHFVLLSTEELCCGLVVPFPLLSTICRHTAVKVLYPAAVSQTAGERTFTSLNTHHFRRTMSRRWRSAPEERHVYRTAHPKIQKLQRSDIGLRKIAATRP